MPQPKLGRPRIRRRKSGISRGAGGVNRTPFEIMFDQSMPRAEKLRQLEEVAERPRSEEELKAARDYIAALYRAREYEEELDRIRRPRDYESEA